MSLYGLVGIVILYFGVTIPTGTLNHKFANFGLLGPGFLISTTTFYGRTQQNKSLEMQVRDMYGQEIERYENFFKDKGYDD